MSRKGRANLCSKETFNSRFRVLMGRVIESPEVFAVDYYGYVKKTRGFYRMVESISGSTKGQVKCVEVPLFILQLFGWRR